ncbi:MFS transporter [Methylobacterium haplocladii]|uniref:MFS transporter n=1 Tax=Methylobacterium haplocladii TaxID=1176176 RepID=A0A512IQK2_9HYPH|nr:MFS transporter [Methylobacterium haplocladii]GEO99955.1 MFS transporter [Methylobacterium haplocladii]GJD86224.1 Putative tartrate transporter [Methylobacterium haplocladii]GLS59669.1 MFS transporter [Methylobacterium haplocladii]
MTNALFRKVSRRLLPFLMLCYFVAYLDRVNVGFAALTMNRDLGLSPAVYGFGAGVFFLGYFLFEVPSNVILEKVGARAWIARIMISWSLVSASTAFVVGERSFFLVRFLLGLAEAGFFPGIILYLTYWYPSERRAGIVGTFMMAVPVSAAIGSPLSAWIMAATDGAHGLAGWQWLYLLEAAPSLLLGIAVLFVLTDRPEVAAWLTPAERDALATEIARDRQATARPKIGLMQALVHPQVLGLAMVYLGLSAGLYGIGLWLPQIVKGFGLTTLQTGLVAGIPYVVAAAGMIAWTRRSDRRQERIRHVAIPAIAGGLALAASGQTGAPIPAMALLSIATLGVFCALPTFWTLPTALLTGSAAAGGIALINAIGGLGGFIGPYLVGWIKDATGRFDLALAAIAAIMIAAGALTLILGRAMRRA